MATTPRPAQPFTPGLGGSVAQQLAALADAISKKADTTSEPVYSAVNLISPGGTVFRVSVSNTGALQSTVVGR